MRNKLSKLFIAMTAASTLIFSTSFRVEADSNENDYTQSSLINSEKESEQIHEVYNELLFFVYEALSQDMEKRSSLISELVYRYLNEESVSDIGYVCVDLD